MHHPSCDAAGVRRLPFHVPIRTCAIQAVPARAHLPYSSLRGRRTARRAGVRAPLQRFPIAREGCAVLGGEARIDWVIVQRPDRANAEKLFLLQKKASGRAVLYRPETREDFFCWLSSDRVPDRRGDRAAPRVHSKNASFGWRRCSKAHLAHRERAWRGFILPLINGKRAARAEVDPAAGYGDAPAAHCCAYLASRGQMRRQPRREQLWIGRHFLQRMWIPAASSLSERVACPGRRQAGGP